MNNTQLYVSVGVPFFTLLVIYVASTISNRSAVSDLRAENRSATDDLRAEMRAGFEAISKRLDGIDKRLDRVETKLDRLTEEVYKLHEGRISRLEERVFSRAS